MDILIVYDEKSIRDATPIAVEAEGHTHTSVIQSHALQAANPATREKLAPADPIVGQSAHVMREGAGGPEVHLQVEGGAHRVLLRAPARMICRHAS
jgi:hypothetical protein